MSLMMDEQKEVVYTLKNLSINNDKLNKIVKFCKNNDIKNIVLVARGTSNHAGLYFKYLVESTTDMRVCKYFHSTNTILNNKQNMDNSICIAISQSGKSPDTYEVLKMAKEMGALTISISNYNDSPIAKLADFSLLLNCGEEKSVAATKTFTSEIALLEMFARKLANKDDIDFSYISKQLQMFIDTKFEEINNLAKANLNIDNLIVLSRGTTLFLGKELCLKLIETSYKLAKEYSIAEFVHGPFALMDETRTAIMFAPKGEFTKDFINMAKKLKKVNVNLIAFSDIDEVLNLANSYVKMPTDNKAMPYFYILALQCFAYSLSTNLGLNPDVPRGLHKVTTTK